MVRTSIFGHRDSPGSGAHHRRIGPPITAVALLGVGASLLSATSASADATDVVISEIMYGPISELDGDEFLELANRGSTPVDLSGWSFGGITLVLPAGASIAAGGRFVVAQNAAQFQATYGVAPAAVYTSGTLSNGGEAVTLRDASAAVIDTVTYDDFSPWPITADEGGKSLELIDPSIENNDYLNWASSTAAAGHTAGTVNSVAGNGLGPRITNVVATPTVLAANQAVTVTATVTGQTGSPMLLVTRDHASEQAGIAMTSTGGDNYTATIPGAAAGHLIRYRVRASNAARASFLPRVDDSSPRMGVVAQSGVTSAVPVLEWFIADADYNAIVANPTADIIRPAVLAAGGIVYDNIAVSIRGESTQTSTKPSWKIEMPKNHTLAALPGMVEAVDEFAMQSDFSDGSFGRPALAFDAYLRAGMPRTQTFPVRTQRNAAFQGLYKYLDLYDGTWRDREGYSDDEVFKAGHGAFDATRPLVEYRFEKKEPADGDFTDIEAFLNGVDLTGASQRDHLLASADIPEMINYAATTAIVQHVDSISKNFYLIQDSGTGRWEIIPWDLDHTFGNGCCSVNSPFVTPAEPQDQTSELMRAILAVPEWREMYFRRLRTQVNDILAPGRLEALYDAQIAPAQPEATLDYARWPRGGTVTYANQRTALFNAITARRNAFANDSRVPGNQSAAPNIIINEIQHSPVGGNTSEFLELHNPSTTEAVDLSGWSIADGVTLNIQPGTVILPGRRMTFVANDPAFRLAYGARVFVGGTYTGDLAASETLTLRRPDGSTADTVTYGGAGWPQVTAGPSLELTNPATDNNDGANWAASQAAGGTPGAPNAGGTVITAPDAPLIGTASPGNVSATVRWAAPLDDGGAAVNGYEVRVVNPSNVQVGALRPAVATATSLVVTGLTNGTAYRFQVRARNSVGTGSYSAFSAAVTPTTATVPGRPVIGNATVGAAGGALTAIARWTPPSSTGGSAITGYRVTALRMSSSAANATVLSRTDSPVLGASVRLRQFTFTAAQAGNYRFEVVAINAVGPSVASLRSNNVVPR